MANPSGKGLEDVTAGDTSICSIDGEKGELRYRGISIHEFVEGGATFEEVAWLLWHAELPTAGQLVELSHQLDGVGGLPTALAAMVRSLPRNTDPMAALRTVVSALAFSDPDAEDDSREANLRKAVRLLAQVPQIVAAFDRLRKNRQPGIWQHGRGIAWNFLWMLHKRPPSERDAHVFDTCLVLHADHEFNASTFAARVTAATLTDLHSALTSAIGALKGPLHGGANTAVFRMLEKIGAPENVEPFLKDKLERKKKVPGFGHRVYRTEDPRCVHLRRFSEEMSKARGAPWYEISARIEKFMREEKGLNANVDFYSASVYALMGISADLFTPIFAVSRTAGWIAHVLEQYADNRLIRPRGRYTGPAEAHYTPLAQRTAG